jgi:hypothetical protein
VRDKIPPNPILKKHNRKDYSKMTVRFLKVIILLGGLLGCTLAMNAQSEVVTVHVPFAFQAGDKLLPAGDYSVDRGDASNVLVIHGGFGNSSAFLTMVVDSAAKADTASLIFARQGGTLVLSAIRLPGQQSRVLFAPHAPLKGGVAAVSVSSR